MLRLWPSSGLYAARIKDTLPTASTGGPLKRFLLEWGWDGGSTAKYTYNALNERVRVDLAGSSEEFIFDPFGNHTSAHDAIGNSAWADWVYWGASRTRVAVDTNSQTYFDHQDWAGTERAMTFYNGSAGGYYTSLPFGDGYSASGSDIDPYHFAMLDHDSTSDTDHATFRQYGSTKIYERRAMGGGGWRCSSACYRVRGGHGDNS